MNKYTLSEQSQMDLEALLDFSIFKFGRIKSEGYFTGLRNTVENIAINPHMGRQRFELKRGLYSFNYKSHTIYYAITSTGIRLIRILHQSRDLKDLF